MKSKHISIITLLGSIAVALLIFACADDGGDGGGGGGTTSFKYVCANGTAVDSLDDKPDTEGVNKCASCDSTYLLVGDDCESFGITIELSSTTESGATFTATATHNATLHWVVYTNEDTTPADAQSLIDDAQSDSGTGATRSGTAGEALTAEDAKVITIGSLQAATPYTLYAAITSQSGNLSVLSDAVSFTTLALGIPAFISGPAIVQDNIAQTSADITLTANESTQLYWVLYDSEQTTLTADALITAAQGSVGDGVIAVSGSNETITEDTPTTISLGQGTADNPTLNALTDYYFYAVLADTDNNQVLSDELPFTTTGYAYVCEHGKKLEDVTDTDGSIHCISCNNYYKLDTDTNNCVPTVYTCTNGTKVTDSTPQIDEPEVPNKNIDVEKCTACDNTGDIITNGACVAFAFSVAPAASGTTASGTTITTTASHDATLHWVIYEGHDVSKSDATTVYNEAQDDSTVAVAAKSGSTGITLTGGTSQSPFIGGSLAAETDYTVYVVITATDDTTKRALSSGINVTTTVAGVPGFTAQPAATDIAQETATITLTADESTDLYWILATTKQTPTNDQIKDATVGGDIIAVNQTNDSVTAGTVKSIPLSSLSPKQPYFFYALLQDTDANQTASNELSFETVGIAYKCDNGTAADGTATTEINNCASCNDYYKLNTEDNSCVRTQYSCANGTAKGGNPNENEYGTDDDKNVDIEQCIRCTTDDDHIVHNGLCVAFAFDGQPTISNIMANGATITATATHDATLHWVVYADGTTKDSAATVVDEAKDGSSAGIARSGSTGVALTGGDPQSTDITGLVATTDYELYVTITSMALNDLSTGDSKVVILSESITLNTNTTGVPNFTNQPVANAQQTTATVTLTANESTDLYWVVYNSAQTLSAPELKDAAEGNVGGSVIAVSGSGETVVESVQKTIPLMNLSPLATYHFYALLEDSDGNQTTATALPFTTSSCNDGYSLVNDTCVFDLVGLWQFDTDNTCATSNCFVALTGGTAMWHGNCPADAMPYAPSHTTAYELAMVDGQPVGLTFDTPGSPHDFTIDAATVDGATGYFQLNPQSTSFMNTNRYLCAQSGLSPLVATDIDLTSATITVIPSDTGTLYWVLYDDATPTPSSLAVVNSAGDSTAGAARSDAGGTAVTALTTATISISSLNAFTDYDLYAVLVADINGDNNNQRILSDRYDLQTVGYNYACDNGTLDPAFADMQTNTENVQRCSDCMDGFYKHGSGACLAHGTLQDGYGVLANGVTVSCPGVDNLASFTINDITYTKRSKLQIDADSDRSDAPTTCTTGITNMAELFNGKDTFNGDISHWDVSGVITMEAMFRSADAFTGNINNWDVSKVETMMAMFRESDFNQDISGWQTNSLTNIIDMFLNAPNFNQEIGKWNTDNLTGMRDAFRGASSFDGNIGSWNTSMVTDMNDLFNGATMFNQDISKWDTEAVSNMNAMFNNAAAFDQNISGWCVSKVDEAPSDFAGGTTAAGWMADEQPTWADVTNNNCSVSITTQPDVTTFTDTTAAISLTASEAATVHWILYTDETTHQDDTALKTAISMGSGVQDSSDSTYSAPDDMPLVINLTGLTHSTTYHFYALLEVVDNDTIVESALSAVASFTTDNPCGAYEKLDTDGETCIATVYVCDNGVVDSAYDGQTPEGNTEENRTTDVQKCGSCTTTGYLLFNDVCMLPVTFTVADNGKTILCDTDSEGNVYLDGIPGIINGDSTVVYTKRNNKADITVGNAVTTCTSGVTDMSHLFRVDSGFGTGYGGTKTFNEDITHWDTSKVTDMQWMFAGTRAFNQDIGNWDVGEVRNMDRMFFGIGGATQFNQDIGSWDVSQVTNMQLMFYWSKFNQDIGDWDVRQVTNMTQMFYAGSIQQNLHEWCVAKAGSFSGFNGFPLVALTAEQYPQFSISGPRTRGNNCPINFVYQPTVDDTATTTINLTPSKDGTLYWALYSAVPATAPTLAELKAATAGSDSVVQSSGTSGTTAMDDTEWSMAFDSLGAGTYYFYAGLENSDSSESVLSENAATLTIP